MFAGGWGQWVVFAGGVRDSGFAGGVVAGVGLLVG